MKDEKHYNDEGFTRIQESAMCVVGDLKGILNQFRFGKYNSSLIAIYI